MLASTIARSEDDIADGVLIESTELGPVTATVKVDPGKPLIGDVVTLTVEVVSEADVEVLMPEFGEALDRYRIFDLLSADYGLAA